MELLRLDHRIVRWRSSFARGTMPPERDRGEVYFGDQRYEWVYIPSTGLQWTTTNLALNLTSATGDARSASIWYGGSGSQTPVDGYSAYGKLYCNTDRMHSELSTYLHDGWRMPTYEDASSLINAAGSDWHAIASTYGWTGTSGQGTNTLGIQLHPGGDIYARVSKGYGLKCCIWLAGAYYLYIEHTRRPVLGIDTGDVNAYMAIRLCRNPVNI